MFKKYPPKWANVQAQANLFAAKLGKFKAKTAMNFSQRCNFQPGDGQADAMEKRNCRPLIDLTQEQKDHLKMQIYAAYDQPEGMELLRKIYCPYELSALAWRFTICQKHENELDLEQINRKMAQITPPSAILQLTMMHTHSRKTGRQLFNLIFQFKEMTSYKEFTSFILPRTNSLKGIGKSHMIAPVFGEQDIVGELTTRAQLWSIEETTAARAEMEMKRPVQAEKQIIRQQQPQRKASPVQPVVYDLEEEEEKPTRLRHKKAVIEKHQLEEKLNIAEAKNLTYNELLMRANQNGFKEVQPYLDSLESLSQFENLRVQSSHASVSISRENQDFQEMIPEIPLQEPVVLFQKQPRLIQAEFHPNTTEHLSKYVDQILLTDQCQLYGDFRMQDLMPVTFINFGIQDGYSEEFTQEYNVYRYPMSLFFLQRGQKARNRIFDYLISWRKVEFLKELRRQAFIFISFALSHNVPDQMSNQEIKIVENLMKMIKRDLSQKKQFEKTQGRSSSKKKAKDEGQSAPSKIYVQDKKGQPTPKKKQNEQE